MNHSFLKGLKRHKKGFAAGILIAILFIGLVSFETRDFKIIKNLDIFNTMFKELNTFYVDQIDPEKTMEEAIDGMLNSLDPYTQYISESDLDDFNFMRTGEYGGIGALIRRESDYTIITDPYKGFPADKTGLKAGDVIREIDGQSTKNMEVSKVSELLKGEPNTELELLIERPGKKEPFHKKLIRQKISISGVPYYGMVGNDVGYIRLSNFTSDVSRDAKKALEDLKSQNAKSIILDLRSNPGGLLNEAVEITNLFVPKDQEIVSTRGKVKQWDEKYYTKSQPVDSTIPLVVLVNRSSASASEIVSGAIQDLDRGVILGQRTFGKGLVQTTRPLSYNTQLKLTTAKYYIPSGRCIQALDYTHRNEDGSVGHIPDSLISEFETKHGRVVRDGGGINPDIESVPETPGDITISLYAKGLIFDYATQFTQKHDSIASPEEFRLTPQEWNNFVDFLKGKDYDYQTDSDQKLEQLIETAKEEKYYDKASVEFEALKSKLSHSKEQDLQLYKDEIKELVEEEIVGRYYYQEGRIAAGLREDKQLEKAIEILHDRSQYSSILSGKEGNIMAAAPASTETKK